MLPYLHFFVRWYFTIRNGDKERVSYSLFRCRIFIILSECIHKWNISACQCYCAPALRVSAIHQCHWGQPHEATVVKMAPTRPLASRSFCLLVLLSDHRSLSNLQQRNTEAWYTLHQNYRLESVLVFVQWSPKDSPGDDGRQIGPK